MECLVGDIQTTECSCFNSPDLLSPLNVNQLQPRILPNREGNNKAED